MNRCQSNNKSFIKNLICDRHYIRCRVFLNQMFPSHQGTYTWPSKLNMIPLKIHLISPHFLDDRTSLSILNNNAFLKSRFYEPYTGIWWLLAKWNHDVTSGESVKSEQNLPLRSLSVGIFPFASFCWHLVHACQLNNAS